MRCWATGWVPERTHCNSSLVAPSQPWDPSSSAAWANGAGARPGSCWVILPWVRCSRSESFYSLRSQDIQAGKGLVSTLSRKCWSLQIPRGISYVKGHHNALPQGTLLPAANPTRTVTPLIIFPPSPHPSPTCCLTIDLQFNPMSPSH